VLHATVIGMELFISLGLALAVGLLIGVERGWHERSAAEGTRIAGVRTFGLLGLLGGLWGLLAEVMGEILLGFAFAAVAAVMIIAHIRDTRVDRDYGITTVVAALVTFALGALAVRGYQGVAAAGAVIAATLLSLKPVLHRWLQRLEASELYAGLKLLLISVVLLPVLPNRGYGPWQALNPYEIWWLVVLIAGISFVGYFAMKFAGTGRGIMLTGLFGGTVSSTAVTLNFSRLGRKKTLQRMLSAGVLVAAATMFPRIMLEVAVVNPAILPPLVLPLGLMTLVTYGGAAWFWRQRRVEADTGELPLRNPLELISALQFGLLLVAVMLLAEAFRAWLGETGVYLVAAISGISDVDAITLSLARMARADLSGEVAARAIVLAAMVNTLVKGLLVIFIAGRGMGMRVAPVFVATVLLGGLVVWMPI